MNSEQHYSTARTHLESRIEEIVVIVYFFLNKVNEFGIMVKVTVFKSIFTPGLILQLTVGFEPTDTVNQSDHVARFVG